MDKNFLIDRLSSGCSIRGISSETGKSFSTVRYWTVKYGLTSSHIKRVDWSEPTLRSAVEGAKTVAEILTRLGSNHNGSARDTLKRRALEYDLDLPVGRAARPKNRGNRLDGSSYQSVKRAQSAQREKKRYSVCVYLFEHPCVDCGEADILVLDFDHTGTVSKKSEVSDMVNNGSSLQALMLEISKCEVRCANCHRRMTALRMGGTYRTKYKASVSALAPNE